MPWKQKNEKPETESFETGQNLEKVNSPFKLAGGGFGSSYKKNESGSSSNSNSDNFNFVDWLKKNKTPIFIGGVLGVSVAVVVE